MPTSFCALLGAFVSVLFTASASFAAVNATVDDFEARDPASSGDPMPYRLFRPDGFDADSPTRYPLILFMHGVGEGYLKTWNNGDYRAHSSYNRRQLTGQTAPLMFVNAINRVKHKAFMVAPQICSDQGQAGYTSWTHPNTRARVKALVESLIAEFPIDTDRLYVTGLSLGAQGTYIQAQHYPGFYAAAAPTDGVGDTTNEMIARLPGLPIWAAHGANDGPGGHNNVVRGVRSRGGNVIYSLYANVGHNAWNIFYNQSTGLADWMMAQRRGQPADSGRYVRIDSPASDIVRATNRITLSGVAATISTNLTVSWYNTALGSGAGSTFETRVAASGSTSWTAAEVPLVVGANRIVIVATDASEASFNDTVLVTRLPDDPLNAAPVVHAGPDIVLRAQTSLVLQGDFDDDGRPAGETPETRWTQVAGPAAAAISDATSLQPTVVFSEYGKYTFRLTVSDGQRSASDDCLIDYVPDHATWTSVDVGAPGAAGSSSWTGGQLSLSGAGRMETWLADSLHFPHRALEGNFTLTCRLGSLSAGWVGPMVRRSTDAKDRFAMIGATTTAVRAGYRTNIGGSPTFTSSWGQRPWLRLQRHGDTFTGSYSSDGNTWTAFLNQTIPMEGAVRAGFGIYSGTVGTLANATLQSAAITLDPPATVATTTATADSSAPQILVQWTAAAGATAYRIERAAATDSAFAAIATVPAGELAYLDEGLPGGVAFRYRVMALTAPDREALAFGPVATATTAAVGGIAAWRQAHFGGAENAGAAMDGADPDGDGVVNLIEYAIGGSPTDAGDADRIPGATSVEESDGPRLVFTFTRNKAASDIKCAVEVADALHGPWSRLDPFAAENVVAALDDTPAAGLETRSVRDPRPLAESAQRFMRLRVTRTEP